MNCVHLFSGKSFRFQNFDSHEIGALEKFIRHSGGQVVIQCEEVDYLVVKADSEFSTSAGLCKHIVTELFLMGKQLSIITQCFTSSVY